MASALASMIVPGAGTVADVLDELLVLSQQLSGKEKKRRFVRIHERLCVAYKMLQTMESENRLPASDILLGYVQLLSTYREYLMRCKSYYDSLRAKMRSKVWSEGGDEKLELRILNERLDDMLLALYGATRDTTNGNAEITGDAASKISTTSGIMTDVSSRVDAGTTQVIAAAKSGFSYRGPSTLDKELLTQSDGSYEQHQHDKIDSDEEKRSLSGAAKEQPTVNTTEDAHSVEIEQPIFKACESASDDEIQSQRLRPLYEPTSEAQEWMGINHHALSEGDGDGGAYAAVRPSSARSGRRRPSFDDDDGDDMSNSDDISDSDNISNEDKPQPSRDPLMRLTLEFTDIRCRQTSDLKSVFMDWQLANRASSMVYDSGRFRPERLVQPAVTGGWVETSGIIDLDLVTWSELRDARLVLRLLRFSASSPPPEVVSEIVIDTKYELDFDGSNLHRCYLSKTLKSDVIQTTVVMKGKPVSYKRGNQQSVDEARKSAGIEMASAQPLQLDRYEMAGVQALVWRPSDRDEEGEQLLRASQCGDCDAVDRLANDVNATTKDMIHGANSLVWASEEGHIDITKILTNKGADINASMTDGQTALHRAAAWGHVEIIATLLSKGSDIDALDKVGRNALMYGASRGRPTVVQCLLDAGANANIHSLALGNTSLIMAAGNGHSDVVRTLVEARRPADVSSSNHVLQDGYTALHKAAANGHGQIVRILLEKGADARATTANGDTALHAAAELGHLTIVKGLLEVDANADVVNARGETPLHRACLLSHHDVAEELIKRGAQVNHKAKDGHTPFHFALLAALHESSSDEALRVLQLCTQAGATWDAACDATSRHVASSGNTFNTLRSCVRSWVSHGTAGRSLPRLPIEVFRNGIEAD